MTKLKICGFLEAQVLHQRSPDTTHLLGFLRHFQRLKRLAKSLHGSAYQGIIRVNGTLRYEGLSWKRVRMFLIQVHMVGEAGIWAEYERLNALN